MRASILLAELLISTSAANPAAFRVPKEAQVTAAPDFKLNSQRAAGGEICGWIDGNLSITTLRQHDEALKQATC